MATINAHEAKTNLSRLLDRARAGEEIVIAKAGKPCVRLVPVGVKAPSRRAGTLKGELCSDGERGL